jgi:hypothetical protein
MKNVVAIQTNASQMEEDTTNIAYQIGRLHITPPEQFKGGPTQSYYKTGYNAQDYPYQPPEEE